MKAQFEINVTRSEAARRYLIGATLITAVLAVPALPSWIALFACYPVFTALLQWDPANALLQKTVETVDGEIGDALFVSQQPSR